MIWDLHTLLMVDPHLLDTHDNVSLIREEAFKHPEPLISFDDRKLTFGVEASDVQFRLIDKVDGVFRLWYVVWGVENKGEKFGPGGKGHFVGYAESKDGLMFKPVNVNHVEFQGSKKNNIVNFSVPSDPDATIGGLMIDPLDDEYRYKCIYYRPATAAQMEPGIQARRQFDPKQKFRFIWGIGKSKDGLTWIPPENKENLINANPEGAGLYRAMDGAYVISDQMTSSVQENAGREVKAWISYDGVTSHRVPGWSFDIPQHMTRIYPEFSGVPSSIQFNNAKWVQPHVGLRCARKGPTILALNGYLYYPPYIETFAQTADIGLVVSSTGVAFREVWPMRPFIPKGARGSWDYGMVAQGQIVDEGDQTRFYLTGNDLGNLGGHYRIGMAYIDRDRYGYYMIRGHRDTNPQARKATVNLKPFELPSEASLSINVSHVKNGATVRLQLSDEKGKAIKGFTFKDCEPVQSDGLRQGIKWTSGKKTASLAGRKVKVSIELAHPNCGFVGTDSPRVYAVYLK